MFTLSGEVAGIRTGGWTFVQRHGKRGGRQYAAGMISTYNIAQTWQQNLRVDPTADQYPEVAPVAGSFSLCGRPIASPLGIVAGPLINSDWLLHYAQLGFDWLVYKTVRSTGQSCYPLPNLVPVQTDSLAEPGVRLQATDSMQGSWAVSFGMPSQPSAIWREDVHTARQKLPAKQVLVVSVVGSLPPGLTSLDALANDFALCAKWAAQAGADVVEANFSCPNVSTADGQLYQQPKVAGRVAAELRNALGDVPLILKIGFLETQDAAARLVDAVSESATALAMTNALSAYVQTQSGSQLFEGQPRGICGSAIRDASCQQVARFKAATEAAGSPLEIIGVGGVQTAADAQCYLDAGAQAVGLATSAMIDPLVGVKIRSDWNAERRSTR